jgi:hypothetical protein
VRIHEQRKAALSLLLVLVIGEHPPIMDCYAPARSQDGGLPIVPT